MSAITCRSIRTNGSRCGSPALNGETVCYHHAKVARHHRGLAAQPHAHHPASLTDAFAETPLVLDIPPLEDRESIQLALSMVITAMAQNRIDPRRATAMLYGLQVASANCRHIAPEVPANVVREVVLEDGEALAPDVDPIIETPDSILSRIVEVLEHQAALQPFDPLRTPPSQPFPPNGQPATAEQRAALGLPWQFPTPPDSLTSS